MPDFLFFVGIVVIFDHQIDIPVQVVDQLVAVIQAELNEEQIVLAGQFLPLLTY